MPAKVTNFTPFQANLIALPLFFGFAAAVIAPHAAVWGTEGLWSVYEGIMGGTNAWMVAFAVFLISVVIHELLHGVGFRMAGVPAADVKFGVHWKVLTPYATTRVAMTASQYRRATMLPGIVLGLAPAAIGVAFGWALFTIYGATMFAAACGDALVLWAIRGVPGSAMVRDSDHNVGCDVLDSLSVEHSGQAERI